MASAQQLKEAQYIYRGDEGEYIEGIGQCGFTCDHAHLVHNDDSGRECYRFCNKLQMVVSDYDSCKYYCDDEFNDLCRQFVEANTMYGRSNQQRPQPKKESGSKKGCMTSIYIFLALIVVLWILLVLCVFLNE